MSIIQNTVMQHQICTLSDLNINIQEVYLTMGYRDNIPDDSFLCMINSVYTEIEQLCKPQYVYGIYDGHVENKISVKIGDETFTTGKIITSYLVGTDRFCVFATTAGHEYDAYKKEVRQSGDLLKEFIADSIGSVVAEACVGKIIEVLLTKIPQEELTYPYSPGYCGWKLTEQRKLFALLPDNPCEITLTDSCLMMPIKSVSGIMGIGKGIVRKAYSCSICENKNCYKRKKP